MKILKIMMCLAVAIPLLALTGCGAAPAADSSSVKDLIIEIFRERERIDSPADRSKFQIELRTIRTISVNEKTQKTVAETELVVNVASLQRPMIYSVVYSAQYTADGQLYVTILELK